MRRSLIVIITLLICAPLGAQNVGPGPTMFWEALVRGNQEYQDGRIVYDNLKDERKQFSEHQHPPMTIVSCSDSRVPPELVFNQSLGSLFVVRSAGSVVDSLGLASIEYAITKGYTSLIVVLGHENCGAVKASLAGDDPGSPNLLGLAQRIRASFIGVPWNPLDEKIVKKAVEANTRASAAYLIAQSRIIRDAAQSGKLDIVPAYYEMLSGKVTKLE